MKKEIYFNGRFLTQPITGVQRTAYELVMGIDNLLQEGAIDPEKYSFSLIYSGEIVNNITLKHIKLIKKGILKGNLWEQLELPFYSFGKLLVSMCTVSSLLKRNQLVIVHDASFIVNPSFFSSTFRLWYRFAITSLGKIARKIITVSSFSKSELTKFVGIRDEKIEVMYNAADHILRFDDPDGDFKDKINALKPYCLAVSSLGANKNFNGLSEAIAQIDFKDFNMLIAGGAISTLKHNAAASSAISYLGYVSNEQLKFLYANASLFIFPSFYEGFGIPPLEAMISGCPVLSSNTSAMPEVLENAVVYCNPHNPSDIAAKIKGLIHNPQQLAMLTQAGYLQAAKYSWHASAQRLMVIIAGLQ